MPLSPLFFTNFASKQQSMTESVFHRSRLLLGDDGIDALSRARVIVFGIGGVGSWCVESLVRTGIRNITIVDSDCVCDSNINRQLMADTSTVGHVKVDAMAARIRQINPGCNVTAIRAIYCEETAASFGIENYDYVIDAIDSLKDKAALILHATSTPGVKLFSSMGAALKLDPAHIAVTEFWKVQGCPLAASLRRKFKKDGKFPRRKFKCVYSPELLKNKAVADDTAERANGSLSHITGIFGLTLASLVIQDVIKKA